MPWHRGITFMRFCFGFIIYNIINNNSYWTQITHVIFSTHTGQNKHATVLIAYKFYEN